MTRKSILVAATVLASSIFLALGALANRTPARASRAGALEGTVSGTVVIKSEGGATRPAGAGVVVYFESAPALDSHTRPETRKMSQKNLRFTPALTVIPRGSTVSFPNEDRVFHNVFSLSRARRFDLGLYRDGDSRSVTFKRPGVVDVYCNIHPDMKARINVVPNRFYAITDHAGRFRIGGVPTGTYTLVAWNGHQTSAPLTIRGGQRNKASVIDFELPPGPRARRHLRKDKSPYRRY